MKKLLMVLLAAGMMNVVSAQRGNQQGHDAAYSHHNDRNSNNDYNNNLKGRDRQIQVVNRDFDQQIRSVRFDRFMKPAQKSRRINMLEKQRAQQCNLVMARFSNNHGRYDNDYARNNKRF